MREGHQHARAGRGRWRPQFG